MEKIDEPIVVKKQTWKNHVNGEIYETDCDIEYYKNVLKDEKYQNLLLGDFNEDGAYSVPKEFLKELVDVNKYITEYVDGVYFLIAKSSYGAEYDCHFMLRVEEDEKDRSKKVATLILVENFIGIDEQITTNMKTTIARYRDDDDAFFLQKVARVFHIFDKRAEENGKEELNDEILVEILTLKRKLKGFRNSFFETNEYLSKYYLDNVIAILKKNPSKFSDFVLRQYETLLTLNVTRLNTPNYYRILRFQLDGIINANRHLCDNMAVLNGINLFRQALNTSFRDFESSLVVAQTSHQKKTEAALEQARVVNSSTKPTQAKKASVKKQAVKKAQPQVKKPQQFRNFHEDPLTRVAHVVEGNKKPEREVVENKTEQMEADMAERLRNFNPLVFGNGPVMQNVESFDNMEADLTNVNVGRNVNTEISRFETKTQRNMPEQIQSF